MTEDEMRDVINNFWDSLNDSDASDYEYDRIEAGAFSTLAEYWFMKGWIARGA